ncbi:hypothetical protein BLNAU_22902 [Blattamonas nauphoetae]|uniref:DNA mismatch repair protein HSM3 N-terminal domain-containing protein n=1 Tax=Blattamonas nauphoetae TaxID=2049346 RepID=A0ABQ9WVW6_9EUKA|nr:hypothetical protein BLNAU_22902 [Blattamonas nauphoetae]
MKEETDSLKTSNDALSNGSQESPSTIVVNNEPFLHFDPNSDLSFEDQSTIYNSLVALVKGKHPFDDALQDRAVRFLNDLEPRWDGVDLANRLIMDLVSSSAGSPSGFVNSILTLVSSPHLTVIAAALSFVLETTYFSSPKIQDRLVESDLVSKVLTPVQPRTLPISGNEGIFDNLNRIIRSFLDLAEPSSLEELDITDAVEKYNHREKIFQKTVIPSSPFVTFLISNRHILSGDLFHSFMSLLIRFIGIGPFHRPTLDFVLASPIMMTLSTYLSSAEDNNHLWILLFTIEQSLSEWKKHGPEVSQSGKRMMRALNSEDFEDTLEQTLRTQQRDYSGITVVHTCQPISQLLGSNVEITE